MRPTGRPREQWGKDSHYAQIGVDWMSEGMTNDYYGMLDSKVASGVVNYEPDAVTIPKIGVTTAVAGKCPTG